MTKKHYIKMAKAINEAIKMEGGLDRVNPTIEHIIDNLIDCFEAENPKFDTMCFLKAIYQ